ncbi:MAG: 4-hydroxythreonine-4-phosphate dehydrogenase PdxA [Myxococcota bacterium]|nr:4-hydroxythreonine-4-phosphate dehydrogenase PdxA [Myxococcota bacterium]
MRVGVTLGDPAGVGAEVALRLLDEVGPDAPITFFGSEAQIDAAAETLGPPGRRRLRVLGPDAAGSEAAYEGPPALVHVADLGRDDVRPGVSTPAGAGAQLRSLSAAAKAAQDGRIAALVTGPVSKAAIASVIGRGFTGQTELLARLSGLRSRDVVMAFTGDRIRVALVTTHMALRDVPGALGPERIGHVCLLEIEHLRSLGFERPRIAVAGLNPHAGENGLFGSEERDVIAPAVGAVEARLKSERTAAVVSGPFPADAALRRHVAGEFDAVVAMYHDQATIACRLLAFGATVNVTLGLPYVRTSADHGTAYDIAGAGRADPAGTLAAYKLARKLVRAAPARG